MLLFKRICIVWVFVLTYVLTGCTDKDAHNYIQYVDPLIGSAGHGHVFVGASVPHGMVQLGPNNLSKGWDWCSGYHYSDTTVAGFAHTHLSGTGIADLGDIAFMPVTGETGMEQQDYVSVFSRSDEIAQPGYYSVLLKKYNIQAELTATERVGFHRYTYPEGVEPVVIVDLKEGAKSLESRQGVLESYFRVVNDTTIEGYRYSDEWARGHRVYFTTFFSRPVLSCRIYNSDTFCEGQEFRGNELRVRLGFAPDSASLIVRTGISYTSCEAAARNLVAESDGRSFDTVCEMAKAKWNEALSEIEFESKDKVAMKIFYTALYHTKILPSLFVDTDGSYRGADGQVYNTNGAFTPYTVFSLWDTYRAVHPLYTLTDSRVSDFVNSLLTITEQQNRLPVWHLVGCETDCMVGMHSVPVIVDACLKGFKGIDRNRAWNAVSSFENCGYEGLDDVKSQGYISADRTSWSVARGLEYAIDDYAIAQLAKAMDKQSEYEHFTERSKNYRHYFDPVTGFMRGKFADGSWRPDYDPYHSVHLEDDYVEGNGWQYTWLVPHDVDGLVELFGGKELFLQKFDSLFLVSSYLNEGASVDITGMIGQYAHGNEPSHHTLYLYSCVGEPQRTAQLVREVYDRFYKAEPDGLIGNEDCGQMSAWYIFSAMGFYPVNPVNGEYVFGSPVADKVVMYLNNGKEFTVIARNNSADNKYIGSVKLNGKPYGENHIRHSDIMNGGVLEFNMVPVMGVK